MQSTEKCPTSEFASIHLDETNLCEILTANNEDAGISSHSLSSPINVDLPVLETSAERSPLITFDGKTQCHNLWNAQDSPVLGESASLCVASPIYFPEFSQNTEPAANSERNGLEEVRDKQFMKTILDQVSVSY